jgi:hypothetical protein
MVEKSAGIIKTAGSNKGSAGRQDLSPTARPSERRNRLPDASIFS